MSCLEGSCPKIAIRSNFVSDSMDRSCPDFGFDRRSNPLRVGHESCPIRSPRDTKGGNSESGFLVYNKTVGCLRGLPHGFKTINHVHGFKTMHMAYGFKTMCKANIFYYFVK